jgi:micrococcal nuclease
MRYLPLLLLLITFPAPAETVHEGKVVKIADGDTLTLLVENKQNKIRLSDIDTPERKQPFGTKAKQALSELAFGKQARVVEWTIEQVFPGFGRGHLGERPLADRDGWIVGRVYVDGMDVNRELVAKGYAWVFKYSFDAELSELEALAREKRLGLWADPNPIPPWEWPRSSPSTSSSTPVQTAPAGPVSASPSTWTESEATTTCARDLRRLYGDTLAVVSLMGKQPHESNTTLVGLVASDNRAEYNGQQLAVGCIYRDDGSLVTVFFNSKIADWAEPPKR